jgi:hypothetical protein
MGMFDYIRYQGNTYQTKDTPNQWMDNYEIRDDGTLWVENYDAEWVKDDNGLFGGHIEQKNHRWEQIFDFTGEIFFYEYDGKGKDIEISSYFIKGELKNLVVLKNISPQNN